MTLPRLLLALLLVLSSQKGTAQAPTDAEALGTTSPFETRYAHRKPRSVFWAPLGSLLAPGVDQWVEGQFGYAAAYTGLAWGGLWYAMQNLPGPGQSNSGDGGKGVDLLGVRERKLQLGLMGWQYAGGFSSYHAFRSAVRTVRSEGRFGFLKKEETPADLLLAPFNIRYLTRFTSLIPLSVGALAAYSTYTHPDLKPRHVSKDDVLYTGLFSYGAGTHEEALFRGWLMPVLQDEWESPFWSNTASATLFAMAHLQTVSVPLPQFLMGWYFGWITQRSDWTIGEAIFLHAWWDVISIGISYAVEERKDAAAFQPVIMLPPLRMVF